MAPLTTPRYSSSAPAATSYSPAISTAPFSISQTKASPSALTTTNPTLSSLKPPQGEEWDTFVQHCINHGWYGTENLAAIPGTVGAAPVQNVGAYGIEAKDIIHSVKAIHIATGFQRTLSNHECQFGYRDSIFKNALKGQYIIWSVTFHLRSTFSPNTQYKALSDALAQQGITTPTARQLADTITSVRWSKLPRPEETGSAGSFFKNPIVSAEQYQQLLTQYPDIVAYPSGDQYKLSAGWLIEARAPSLMQSFKYYFNLSAGETS